METKNYYCEYCGQKYTSVSALTSNRCYRHPDGTYKGKHKLYEGSEKKKYTCKHCGQTAATISALTSSRCPRHPKGNYKGQHAPAL
jgi:DNA-directed RNA polymerase subunit RPC12/RpoP